MSESNERREMILATLESNPGLIFRSALDPHDAQSREMQAILADNPERALAALATDSQTLGLSLKGAADALEIILGDMTEERGRELLAAHLTHHRRVELIQGRGDLPSVSSSIAEMDDVIAAMLAEIRSMDEGSSMDFFAAVKEREVQAAAEKADASELSPEDVDDALPQGEELTEEEEQKPDASDRGGEEDGEDSRHSLMDMDHGADIVTLGVLRAWALKLCDRSDYDQFLEFEIAGVTIRRHLIFAVALETRTRDVPATTFDEIGLDPDEAREELRALLDAHRIQTFDADAVERARARLIKHHKEVEGGPLFADAPVTTVEEKAGEIGEL